MPLNKEILPNQANLVIVKIYDSEVTQFESSNYQRMLLWWGKKYHSSVLRENFFFIATSKNDCFSKV